MYTFDIYRIMKELCGERTTIEFNDDTDETSVFDEACDREAMEIFHERYGY